MTYYKDLRGKGRLRNILPPELPHQFLHHNFHHVGTQHSRICFIKNARKEMKENSNGISIAEIYMGNNGLFPLSPNFLQDLAL